MEKLVKLLNEYEKNFAEKFGWVVGQARTYHYDKEDECIRNQRGEEYNFDSLSNLKDLIKWLVDNDKIDIDNEDLESLMSELWEFQQYEKCLLMLLAIQDEPIEFLISLLK